MPKASRGTGAAQDEQISQAWKQIQNERPISLKNSFRQIVAAASYRPGDIKPIQPVLLLNGQGDRLVSPACSEMIHKKWDLELRSHLWAGHDLPLDDGAWVALQLKEWVRMNLKIAFHHEDHEEHEVKSEDDHLAIRDKRSPKWPGGLGNARTDR